MFGKSKWWQIAETSHKSGCTRVLSDICVVCGHTKSKKSSPDDFELLSIRPSLYTIGVVSDNDY